MAKIKLPCLFHYVFREVEGISPPFRVLEFGHWEIFDHLERTYLIVEIPVPKKLDPPPFRGKRIAFTLHARIKKREKKAPGSVINFIVPWRSNVYSLTFGQGISLLHFHFFNKLKKNIARKFRTQRICNSTIKINIYLRVAARPKWSTTNKRQKKDEEEGYNDKFI